MQFCVHGMPLAKHALHIFSPLVEKLSLHCLTHLRPAGCKLRFVFTSYEESGSFVRGPEEVSDTLGCGLVRASMRERERLYLSDRCGRVLLAWEPAQIET